MEAITLVACCGQKLGHPAAAAELYQSDLFRKARKYAERHGRWYVLSALHGLVAPDAVIAPYDLTLGQMSAEKRGEWGRMVQIQIADAGLLGCRLVALAGAGYVRPLETAGLELEKPLRGLSIGKQLQWLKKANNKPLRDGR
jgi:hypothetical protein